LNDVLIICRFAHFASTMSVFGASVFLTLLSPPRLAASLDHSLRRIAAIAFFIAALTLVLWLMLEGAEMVDDWPDAVDADVLFSVLSDTAFGHVWLARILLALALFALMMWRIAPRPLLTIIAGLFLASLGLVGHAAMHTGAVGFMERANQALHITAAGFWLGALVPLLFCLRQLRDPALKSDAGVALRRFSGLGHFAVAAVLLTGVVNTAVILGRLPTNPSSPYQAMLAAKILVVATMALLALYNRYRVVPRLTSSAGPALRSLSRNTWGELFLGAAVLALVSIFATFAPA
jgi:putative copper resistance protein D